VFLATSIQYKVEVLNNYHTRYFSMHWCCFFSQYLINFFKIIIKKLAVKVIVIESVALHALHYTHYTLFIFFRIIVLL